MEKIARNKVKSPRREVLTVQIQILQDTSNKRFQAPFPTSLWQSTSV